MCSAFLWSGSPTQTHKAKVSWEDVCYPKEEGGLGVRRLRDSSKVFALRLIWRLFTQPSSLWVSWTKHYLLRDSSFWDVRDDTKGSWIWRKLLKLRDIAYDFLKMEVRNGDTTFFWFDDWMGMGRLIDITGAIGTVYLVLSHRATVKEATNLNGWCVSGQRSRRFQDLYHKILAQPLPDEDLGIDMVL